MRIATLRHHGSVTVWTFCLRKREQEQTEKGARADSMAELSLLLWYHVHLQANFVKSVFPYNFLQIHKEVILIFTVFTKGILKVGNKELGNKYTSFHFPCSVIEVNG